MSTHERVASGWEDTWDDAADRYLQDFRKQGWGQHMSSLIKSLKAQAEVTGLHAITSMHRLLISPYSCYPDFFEGRRILVEPIDDEVVRVSYFERGSDQNMNCSELDYAGAKEVIEKLCEEKL